MGNMEELENMGAICKPEQNDGQGLEPQQNREVQHNGRSMLRMGTLPPVRDVASIDHLLASTTTSTVLSETSALVVGRIEARIMAEFELLRGDRSAALPASAHPTVASAVEGPAAAQPHERTVSRHLGGSNPVLLPIGLFRRRIGRVASLSICAMGVALLAALFLLMSSLLQSRQHRGIGPDGTVITPTKPAGGAEAQYLFSVPLDKPNTRPMIAGFGLADDGTFWIIDQGKRLQHYSSMGKALGVIDLSSRFHVVYDMEVYGNSIWIYDGTHVVQFAFDGSTIHSYSPFAVQAGMNAPRLSGLDISKLLQPESVSDGHMLVGGGNRYVVVADATITADGKLNPQPIDGYPAYGKLYKLAPGRADTVLAGDVEVRVEVPERILGLSVFKVMPDRSFYVLVEALLEHQYVMHYAVDGKLLEWATVPTMTPIQVAERQIAVGQDGTFYIAQLPYDSNAVASGRADILRLNFYNASLPLPGTSTPQSAPTVPGAVPTSPNMPNVPGAISSPTPSVLQPPQSTIEFAGSLRSVARWKAAQLHAESFAWSPDGSTLAVATSQDVELYNPLTGQVSASHKLEHSGNIVSLAWSSDKGRKQNLLAVMVNDPSTSAGMGSILLLDPSSNLSTSNTIIAGNMLWQMAWSPDGGTLAYSDGWQVYQWSRQAQCEVPKPLPTWPAPLTTHPDANSTELNAVNSLAWSPDGKQLAMSQNRAVKVMDPASGKELLSIPLLPPLRVVYVVWSPDGRTLAGVVQDERGPGAGGAGNVAMLWDAVTGKMQRALAPPRSVNTIAWSSYANLLAVGTMNKGQDGADLVVLYYPSTGAQLGELSAVGQTVDNLAWSPDGRMLAAGSAAGEAVVIFAPGSGPSPTPAPIEPTMSPVPTDVTPIPLGPSGGSTLREPSPLVSPCAQDWRTYALPGSASSNGSTLSAVAGVSPTDIWAVGEAREFGARPSGLSSQELILHWNGTQWSRINGPNKANEVAQPGSFRRLLAVSAVSPTDVWAAGEYRLINVAKGSNSGQIITSSASLIEHWDGRVWSQVSAPTPQGFSSSTATATLASISALSASSVWAVGWYTNGGSDSIKTLTMHWDGKAWSITPNPDPSASESRFAGVAAIAEDDVWAVGQYYASGAGGTKSSTLIEHWDGKAWNIAPAPQVGGLSAIAAVSLSDVWAVGDSILHWNGKEWAAQYVPGGGAEVGFYGVTAISSSDMWAVGYNRPTGTAGPGQPHLFHWNGSTFERIPSTTNEDHQLNAVAENSGTIWAVGFEGVGAGKALVMRYSHSPCPTPIRTIPTPNPPSTTTR